MSQPFNKGNERMEVHNIEPVYNENSKILILGSFPSVRSREMQFFYGHPQNRFWKVLAMLTNEETPQTILQKKDFLIRNKIAVWDVIQSCQITGSSDSSIKNAVPNDISLILKTADIKQIFTNGGTAHKLYRKHISNDDIKLPSTSPANAAFSVERLVNEWDIIKKSLS